MRLTALAAKYGTDKLANGYMPVYERHLPEEVTSILEIGVLGGASLRMWSEFFPQARVWGLDIDPSCKKHENRRVKVRIGSQSDAGVLAALAEEAGGFDVVIDDGSHVNALTLASFKDLWPHTRQTYFIEDLANSYVDLTKAVEGWPGMQHNSGVDYRNDRADMDGFFKECVHGVDGGLLAALHFYPMLAVIER
jgi:hypothetical protein